MCTHLLGLGHRIRKPRGMQLLGLLGYYKQMHKPNDFTRDIIQIRYTALATPAHTVRAGTQTVSKQVRLEVI